MTGNAISADMLNELCGICKNLRGIKDSSMDFTNLEELKLSVPADFEVITGNDADILASLHIGCNGAIVALANSYPELCVGVYESFKAGDFDRAWAYQKDLIRLRAVCRATVPVMAHKYLTSLRGLDMGAAHFPMRELTVEEKKSIKDVALSITL